MKAPELVVLSHLQWTWVWQRPQHIVSRLARNRRTWFIEQPWACAVDRPALRHEQHGDVTRIWLEVPVEPGAPHGHVPLDYPPCEGYAEAVCEELGAADDRIVWLYTPMALELATALEPTQLVYDVMDDLASFDHAPPAMRLRYLQALRQADIVFAGGRSLYEDVRRHRGRGAHLFPSGVELEHFAAAREGRAETPRPVAGYVGVIDERLDLGLVAGLAAALPEWEIHLVGPVTKIDPGSLPSAANLSYPGPVPYADLPEVLRGFDVALMPFALSRATRSISPTKTLEYLAAGLPVVSTAIPDVVADYQDVVDIRHDAAGFADACRRAISEPRRSAPRVERVLARQHWDAIAARMEALLEETRRLGRGQTSEGTA